MENWIDKFLKYNVLHVFVVLLGFVAFNLVILDFLILGAVFSDTTEGVLGVATKVVKKTSKITPTPTQIPYCPSSCLTEIKNAVTTSSNTTVSTPKSKIKDHFIFLGTGSSSSSSWTSISGAQAALNISDYDNVKSVVFEAAVTNPNAGQRVYIRLFNATTETAVFGSTVSFDGNSSGLLTSGSIELPPGQQTYEVQMQAVLAAPANLTLSRIHVITN